MSEAPTRIGWNEEENRRKYRKHTDCRTDIKNWCQNELDSADDNDDEANDVSTAKAYVKDLRYFDHYLDYYTEQQQADDEIPEDEKFSGKLWDFSTQDAWLLASHLKHEFNGTVPLNRYNAIKRFYRWGSVMKKIDENPLAQWNTQKELKLTKTTATETKLDDDDDYPCRVDDIRAMEENAGKYPIRNACLIRLLFHTGCRRDEVASLRIQDIDFDDRTIQIRESIAKNNEERYVGYKPSLDGMLSLWRKKRERWNTKGYDELFIGERGGKLSGEAINDLVVRAANRAGINRPLYADANARIDPETGKLIKNRHLISSHNIRHGTATKMIQDDNCDPYRVSRYMGHKSVEFTIKKYVDQETDDGLPALDGFRPDEDTSN
jgi:integrase/recombinase XerD